jgi:hypothetical protein
MITDDGKRRRYWLLPTQADRAAEESAPIPRADQLSRGAYHANELQIVRGQAMAAVGAATEEVDRVTKERDEALRERDEAVAWCRFFADRITARWWVPEDPGEYRRWEEFETRVLDARKEKP